MNAEAKLTCCLTVGMDALSLWTTSFKSDNPSMISRGEFDAVATDRILELLATNDIRSTFLIPGHTALAYPELTKKIHGLGHEIAYHGWVHEDPREFDLAGQRRIFERGLEALDHVVGVHPRGHVSPAWNTSADTFALVEEFGFLYDGSRMATDFLPVYVRKGDRWPANEPYEFGQLTEVVGLPVAWPLDDVPLFEFVWGQLGGLTAPSVAEEIWTGDLDYARTHCPGGVFNLTIHPQSSGRGHRMLLLERFVEYVKQFDNVEFGCLGDYAERWKANNPIDAWRKANPALAGDGAITELPLRK
jgi:peptidoglycan/xylan/chitin deacetylase (PgdA/CDA1 family)